VTGEATASPFAKGILVTTMSDRANTALLVIDVQTGVIEGAHRRDEVVANIAQLVDKARHDGVPVVWVQHSDDGLKIGSDGWQYVPELVREDSEPLVHKSYGDSFEDTDLEEVLAKAGVGRLVVTGGSDRCVHPLHDPRCVRSRVRRHPRQ
jgi:nicotinamidase-related amidase